MAKLGEAYVLIRADLSKFDKDLDLGLKRAVDKFERDLNRQFGKKIGLNIGGGAREGVRESFNNIGQEIGSQLNIPANSTGRRAGRQFRRGVEQELRDVDPVKKALASLTAALEDGFSALPAEAKAVVGAAILAAIIPAGALISAAFGGALITGINAAGVALAFQFEEVEARGKSFVELLRVRLVSAAESFGNETINAFDFLDAKLWGMQSTLRSIFEQASVYLLPLTDGVARLFDEALQGLDRGLQGAETQQIIDSLVNGFEYIGVSIGDAFEILLSNPNLDLALNDLLLAVGDLVTIGAELLSWTLDVYDNFRDAIEFTIDFTKAVYDLVAAINALFGLDFDSAGAHFMEFLTGEKDTRIAGTLNKSTLSTKDFTSALKLTLSATDDEVKALEDLQRALDDSIRSARNAISTQIDYEESIRRSRDALKESKGSIDLTTEAGSRAAEEILKRIDLIDRSAQEQIDSGRKTDAEAQKFFEKEIARLRAEFVARGGNIKQFDALYGQYIKLAGIPEIPDPTDALNLGAKDLKQSFDLARLAWERALASFKKKPANGNIKVEGGTQLKGFADGGRITEPSIIAAGEGGRPELILPETQPLRSMQLLASSPLANVIGGGPSVVYAIFDGEPFQARIVKTAKSVNRQAARTINQGPRNI